MLGRSTFVELHTFNFFSFLRIFHQDEEFDSLHWFKSAINHFKNKKNVVREVFNMDLVESGMSGLQLWSEKLCHFQKIATHNW